MCLYVEIRADRSYATADGAQFVAMSSVSVLSVVRVSTRGLRMRRGMHEDSMCSGCCPKKLRTNCGYRASMFSTPISSDVTRLRWQGKSVQPTHWASFAAHCFLQALELPRALAPRTQYSIELGGAPFRLSHL